ncbi:CBN-HBL-1 protein [Caenorhabditis brenneri]|uniref:CBN-HBL-1 protein n=1 Tax=Caenorhabditis brenneri TaxID=135651 RepID=G0M6K5_CAEBE|nr:CBN-HBL-1 protein [Caenorhabditis brenneri]
MATVTRNKVTHLEAHAPFQVHTDSTPAAKNKKAKGARRSQMPFGYSDIINKPALIGDEWPPAGNWSANNNSLGDWDKCCEAASKVPQHLAEKFAKTSLKMLTAQQPVEKIHPGHGYVRRDEHDRKSAERIGSYDVSASTSPGNDEGVHSDNDHVDVDGTTQTEMEVDEKEDTILPECHPKPVVKIEVKSEVIEDKNEEASLISESAVTPTPAVNPFFPTTLVAPIAVTPQITNVDKMQSPLITDFLKLTQEQFQEVLSEAAKIRKASTDSVGFVRSGTSAFSNIEPKELLIRSPSANNNTLLNNNNNNNNNNNEETSVPTISSASTPTTTSASFCRPPGLGPVAHPPTQNGQTPMLVCPICGFMCPSKFHFNSHMNTHGDHQCSMCDYTSRTEGRLKKHMRESHTVEEQLKAGLELEPVKENGTQSTSPKGSVCSKDSNATSPINETFNLSTTMASILDSTTNAIAATSTTEAPSALAALTLDMSSTPNLLSTLAQTNFGASALDQIKAISENPNFMPENGMNLATALGAVSQAIKGEPASPEKSQNGESRRSSSGKLKIFKCKQCGHQSLSKDDQWAHARSHIPAEKQLNCQHCNFVTEYKHHLEYHYRNHIGSKPFQCKKCSYNCVNKSMLNSHMKSHTNHYQFRCMDCTYATKYCHSLKLHLKKYNHRRVPEGMDGSGGDASPPLTSSDATITFSPLTNVKTEIKSEPVEPVTSIASTFPFNPMMANNGFSFANQMLLNKFDSMRNAAQVPSFKCPMCDFVGGTQEEQMRHSMSHILNSTSVPTTIASLYNSLNLPTLESLKPTTAEADESMDCEVKIEDDGSTESHCDEDEEMDQSSDLAVSPTGSSQVSSVDDEQVKKEPIATNGKHSPMSNDSAVERDRESADDAPHSPSDMASVASPPHLPVSIAAPIPMVPKPENFLQAFLNTQAATQFAFNFASQGPFVQCQHCSTPFNVSSPLLLSL